MADESKPDKRLFIIIAAVGIVLELIVIVLLASERISIAVAMPLLMVGMLVAFVPIVLSSMKSKG